MAVDIRLTGLLRGTGFCCGECVCVQTARMARISGPQLCSGGGVAAAAMHRALEEARTDGTGLALGESGRERQQ